MIIKSGVVVNVIGGRDFEGGGSCSCEWIGDGLGKKSVLDHSANQAPCVMLRCCDVASESEEELGSRVLSLSQSPYADSRC